MSEDYKNYYMNLDSNSVFTTVPKTETYSFKAEDVSKWEIKSPASTSTDKTYHDALRDTLASYIDSSNVNEAKDAVIEVKDTIVESIWPPVTSPPHDYKFDEDKYLDEIKNYIISTYKAHYAKGGKTQAFELIASSEKADGFTTGSIMKYAARYGEKDGYNRKDLLKIAHYAILQLYVHDLKKRN